MSLEKRLRQRAEERPGGWFSEYPLYTHAHILQLSIKTVLRMAKKVPMRLRYLRVKSGGAAGVEGPHAAQLKACEEELNSLLSCWRANGVDSAPCMAAVQALAMCSGAMVRPVAERFGLINLFLYYYFLSCLVFAARL